MSASDDAEGQKLLNFRPLLTDEMRRNGCEGVAMVVGVTLIDSDGPGAPLLQKLELQLKIASGIAYLGLLTMLQAREVREGRAKGRPRAVVARELAEDLARELPMRWGHDALTQTAEHSIKTETSFVSVKAFNDSYRDIGKRVPIDQAARAAEDAWIDARKRILRLLGIAALRAQVMFPGVRDIMANEGRYGEPKNPARPSAIERKLMLEPMRQAQLHLSPSEMLDLAFHGSINPADLWLDHRLLHSVFEAAICAGRCRDGKAGEMTRFGVLQLARCLFGDLREICVDEAMFAFCLDSYTAILKAFNAHADLEPEDLKDRLLTQIDAALAVPGELRDTITIQPLAAPPTRPRA